MYAAAIAQTLFNDYFAKQRIPKCRPKAPLGAAHRIVDHHVGRRITVTLSEARHLAPKRLASSSLLYFWLI